MNNIANIYLVNQVSTYFESHLAYVNSIFQGLLSPQKIPWNFRFHFHARFQRIVAKAWLERNK